MNLQTTIGKLHTLTLKELRTLNEAVVDNIKRKRKQKTKLKKASLSKGDPVQITGGTEKYIGMTGEIARIKQTRAIIDIPEIGQLDCPISCMKKIG